MKEFLYKLKRKIQKFHKKYFSVENFETFILSDKQFVKRLYKAKKGKRINLNNPKTFSEKQNWLKLYDRRPEYTIMSDKYMAKKYIAERVGEQYIVPVIGVWDNADDIDFSVLPEQFVLKCNHNSDVVICTDKSAINEDEIKEKLNIQLKDDYYLHKREWPYKNIPRKIICEPYLKNSNGEQLLDYNIFCFNGIPRFIKVGTKKADGTLLKDFYDLEWNYLDLSTGEHAGNIFAKPDYLDEMLDIAKVLSKDIPHLRVDFLYCENKLYSGELTFFSAGGFMKMQPEEWDEILGEWLELPKKHRR